MPEFTVTNNDILTALLALRSIIPHNALCAVKLGRLRKALKEQAEPVIAAFDDTGKRHAKKDDAGELITKKSPEGEPLFWQVTGTPVYDIETPDAFNAEMKAMYDEVVTVTAAVRLQEKDLEAMTVSTDVGDALLPFVNLS